MADPESATYVLGHFRYLCARLFSSRTLVCGGADLGSALGANLRSAATSLGGAVCDAIGGAGAVFDFLTGTVLFGVGGEPAALSSDARSAAWESDLIARSPRENVSIR